MTYLLVLFGLIFLLLGGEALVRGASVLALRRGISPLVIGLTIVAFGTSLPELVTSLQAALAGQPDIAVGNVVGSNIANLLLILGAAALVSPVLIAGASFRRDAGLLVGATVLAIALAQGGMIGRIDGAILIAGLALFLWATMQDAAADVPRPDEVRSPLPPPVLILGGLIALVGGAQAFVSGAAELARTFGISEAVIGLTLVAVGTSLPELVTSVIAARRGHSALAFGNVIGSNIFNIVGILGITALVRPLPVAAQIQHADLWVMAAATVLVLGLCRSEWRLSRAEGGLLIALYAGYIVWLAL